MSPYRRAVWAIFGLLAIPVIRGPAARADVNGAAPTITADRTRVRPGDEVVIAFNGWRSLNATLSVCGNLARRGSPDCDQIDSAGVSLAVGAPRMISEFTVNLPPVPCPCVIEALSIDHSEASFAPIDIVGAPVAPVATAAVRPPVLAIAVRTASRGIVEALRSTLGGPTSYDVTVVLHNPSTEPISDLALTASAGRNATSQIRSVDLPSSGIVAAGATWSHVTHVVIPAPVIGHFIWDVIASGSGPPVHAEVRTKATPWGLIAVAGLLVADVTLMVARRVRRSRRRPVVTQQRRPTLRIVPDAASTAA